MEKLGELDLLPKKEVAKLLEERNKLEANLGGIKDMKGMPGCIFIVDPKKESIAVAEAHALNIPIVAIVDTNCDPDQVDVVIPANDDASKSIETILDTVCAAMAEGIEERKAEKVDTAAAGEEGEVTPKRERRRVRKATEEATEAAAE